METVTRILSTDEYREGIAGAIEFYRSFNVDSVLVAYGWSCDCPQEELYIDKLMPLEELQAFIAKAEATNHYRVGRDNLHVKDQKGKSEFLFCHEADIHFVSEDKELCNKQKAIWEAKGFLTARNLGDSVADIKK